MSAPQPPYGQPQYPQQYYQPPQYQQPAQQPAYPQYPQYGYPQQQYQQPGYPQQQPHGAAPQQQTARPTAAYVAGAAVFIASLIILYTGIETLFDAIAVLRQRPQLRYGVTPLSADLLYLASGIVTLLSTLAGCAGGIFYFLRSRMAFTLSLIAGILTIPAIVLDVLSNIYDGGYGGSYVRNSAIAVGVFGVIILALALIPAPRRALKPAKRATTGVYGNQVYR